MVFMKKILNHIILSMKVFSHVVISMVTKIQLSKKINIYDYMTKNSYWVWMSSNKPKLMSKLQFFYNSCYFCLCGATLMACELWKIVFIE